FLDNAFGNFKTLLERVTLSPVMGEYLNMVDNNKPANGVNPNENYAREIMQLFSIGVWKLNRDGTLQLDADGQPIPTYDQDVIEGSANVFTGWTYAPLAAARPRNHNPKNYLGDMVEVPADHSFALKLLLDDTVDPPGKSMSDDLDFALQTVFMHPNVGPF